MHDPAGARGSHARPVFLRRTLEESLDLQGSALPTLGTKYYDFFHGQSGGCQSHRATVCLSGHKSGVHLSDQCRPQRPPMLTHVNGEGAVTGLALDNGSDSVQLIVGDGGGGGVGLCAGGGKSTAVEVGHSVGREACSSSSENSLP